MGSLFNIVIYSRDSLAAATAAGMAFRLIDSLNGIYSDYLPGSELNRLSAAAGTGRWVQVSAPLFEILQKARDAGRMSRGSFDVTSGPLVRIWRRARAEKKMPDMDSIQEARSRSGYQLMDLDASQHAVRLTKTSMQLDLGGIAKGETAQRVCNRLKELGFPFTLVDAGGDIVAGSVPPGIKGWHVAINLPGSEEAMEDRLLITNKAVTTSGDLYQYVELNGKRYSHLINPVTGMALTSSRNVTVLSDKGIDADWLTKACTILPISAAIRLIKKFPGTEVQIAVIKKGKPVFYRSAGFKNYLKE